MTRTENTGKSASRTTLSQWLGRLAVGRLPSGQFSAGLVSAGLLSALSLALVLLLAACNPGAGPASAPTIVEPDLEATPLPAVTATATLTPTPIPLNPLTIASMRGRDYAASDIKIEQKLTPGSNYSRYVASYTSDGLKIYAMLTVPAGAKPKTGWPVVIFNHGYIPPAEYKTTERYAAYVDAFARSGYIVFRSDYRGHGNSEGEALGGYSTPDYTIDVLNALASIKRFPDADPNRIGMWGHSMGGQITLRAMVVSKDIRAGVIWSGVVASYADLLYRWRTPAPGALPPSSSRRWRDTLIDEYGSPEGNPQFWDSISPNTYVKDLSGPIQLHHSTTDPEVPFVFSELLNKQITEAGKTVEFYSYPADDHNISKHLVLALQRSVAFFDKYVKK